jgi:hypothetical protein
MSGKVTETVWLTPGNEVNDAWRKKTGDLSLPKGTISVRHRLDGIKLFLDIFGRLPGEQ